MKGFVTFCLVFCVCWFSVLPVIAAAQKEGSRHISTGEILEFSLSRLKEGIQKIKQKNDRLTFENAALYDDIQYLQRVRQRLVTKKAELLGKTPSSGARDNQAPSMKTAGTEGREQRTKDLIAVFKRDVSGLRKEIRLLEGRLDQKRFDSEKRLLLEQKRKGLKNRAKLERNLNSLAKRNRAPEKTIERFKNEKMILEAEITALEGGPTGPT